MEIINVTSKEELDYLYKNSALTIEGLTLDSIPDFLNYLKENTTVNKERAFVISGKLMNETYHLSGKNAYPDDLNIVSVSLEDINSAPIITKRFEIGAKWFDDIVDNNKMMQRERKGRGRG